MDPWPRAVGIWARLVFQTPQQLIQSTQRCSRKWLTTTMPNFSITSSSDEHDVSPEHRHTSAITLQKIEHERGSIMVFHTQRLGVQARYSLFSHVSGESWIALVVVFLFSKKLGPRFSIQGHIWVEYERDCPCSIQKRAEVHRPFRHRTSAPCLKNLLLFGTKFDLIWLLHMSETIRTYCEDYLFCWQGTSDRY